MLKKYTGKLYCFSPPVMLATFLIEFGLLFYTIWRYKMTTVSRLVAVVLGTLGTFQLAEYMVCGGLGLGGTEWARLGYVSITLLPALGIHLVTAIAGKDNESKLIVGSAYGTAALFAVSFAFVPGAINLQECRANYAVFNMAYVNDIAYSAYYYGWLLIGMFLAWNFAKKVPKRATALYAMIIGYAVFITPTTIANLADPSTIAGIPSIMCGFAVLLAFVLVGKVLPSSGVPERVGAKRSWRIWES